MKKYFFPPNNVFTSKLDSLRDSSTMEDQESDFREGLVALLCKRDTFQ